ncbi:TPA: hypothetical protein QHU17_004565 [Enterobacter hormaechei subsp. xiangfangensis]|nr:hypothetical protein [Enterobacter hormaechei subsp. xiangfangensis]
MKFDDSNWFWVNKDKATLFSILEYKNTPWVLTNESCKANTTTSSLSTEHNAIICKFLDDHKGLPRLNALIREQNIFFGVTSVFLVSFSLCWLEPGYIYPTHLMQEQWFTES